MTYTSTLTAPGTHRWSNYLLVLASLAGILALLALAVSGPGSRFGLWNFGVGFGILRYAAYGGIAAMVAFALGAIWRFAAVRRAPALSALVGLIAGAVAFGVPWLNLQSARGVPPIHDISTDTSDPPQFVAVVPLRRDAPNPPEYAGAEVAAQQAAAYPDIVPIVLEQPPAQAFETAQRAVADMGWELIAAIPAEGRIEATDTTFWYGFKDDVVIRIRADGAGSRLDIRSKSRVGRSDVGTNARRIREFRERL
jgi:uncharacterized protein (DUF1499 family)